MRRSELIGQGKAPEMQTVTYAPPTYIRCVLEMPGV